LKGKGVKFEWEDIHQEAFEKLKLALCESPTLQVPDSDREFVLATDASDMAISAVINQRINGHLAPIGYYSKMLTSAEKKYSTYEKECLAVVLGCEKARTYLEHKVFELHCDNLALCWLFKNMKDVGRIGRWILRLAPFKFKFVHTKGTDNAVPDALSRMFEGEDLSPAEKVIAAVQGLPLIYTSLESSQKEDGDCVRIRAGLARGDQTMQKYRIHNRLVCFHSKGSSRKRYIIPKQLQEMVVKYFHDSPLSGHLGMFKTWKKVSRHFYWSTMKEDIFQYVRKCELCQRAKPAQNTQVGLHSAMPATGTLDRIFRFLRSDHT
jgi:hypothetical protein